MNKPINSNNMEKSVKRAAMSSDGKSRRCGTCPLQPCTQTEFRVCSNAFSEGFRKGAAWNKKQSKNTPKQ